MESADQVHALLSRAMPLGRALEAAGLGAASRHMRTLASRPNSADMRPATRVKCARRVLRHWMDAEPGQWLEEALGELIIAVLTESAVIDQARPIVVMKRRLVSAGGK